MYNQHKRRSNICLTRTDRGWYCDNAGSVSFFPQADTCKVQSNRVFCDTMNSLTLPSEVNLCNIDIFNPKYDCKIMTSKTDVSSSVITSLGAIVSCYGKTKCTASNKNRGIIKTFSNGCDYVSNKGVDTVSVGNTLYYVNKQEGKSLYVKGEPIINFYDPLVFPSDEFDASISQVNEKINQSLAFIRKSDELLHNVNAGKSTTNIMITTIIIVIIVILLSLIAVGLLLYCKARSTPVTLSKDQLSGINNIAFSN